MPLRLDSDELDAILRACGATLLPAGSITPTFAQVCKNLQQPVWIQGPDGSRRLLQPNGGSEPASARHKAWAGLRWPSP